MAEVMGIRGVKNYPVTRIMGKGECGKSKGTGIYFVTQQKDVQLLERVHKKLSCMEDRYIKVYKADNQR